MRPSYTRVNSAFLRKFRRFKSPVTHFQSWPVLQLSVLFSVAAGGAGAAGVRRRWRAALHHAGRATGALHPAAAAALAGEELSRTYPA